MPRVAKLHGAWCQYLLLDSAVSASNTLFDIIFIIHVHFFEIAPHCQAYVALSRATTLDGLHLVEFHKGVVKAHESVKKFYAGLEVKASAFLASLMGLAAPPFVFFRRCARVDVSGWGVSQVASSQVAWCYSLFSSPRFWRVIAFCFALSRAAGLHESMFVLPGIHFLVFRCGACVGSSVGCLPELEVFQCHGVSFSS